MRRAICYNVSMKRKQYIVPVSISSHPPKYNPLKYNTPETLTNALRKYNCNITLKESLKGGEVSQVYASSLHGTPVVVKHTGDLISSDPVDLSLSKKDHLIDTKVLKLLQHSAIRVPKVIAVFPGIYTTIMEDLRAEGYMLLQTYFIKGKLPIESAGKIGESLALLGQTARMWKPFKTSESAEESIYERGLELRLAYPNDQKQYLFLEKEFISNNQYWVWPDGHPKNMLINAEGDVSFIDFGRSHWGDQRYMLPNFLAHIVIYALSGYINKKQSSLYIRRCIEGYRKHESVDEPIFCQYLAMEVLHRANGKWIEGINIGEQKIPLYKFGLTIFDKNITTFENLLQIIEE